MEGHKYDYDKMYVLGCQSAEYLRQMEKALIEYSWTFEQIRRRNLNEKPGGEGLPRTTLYGFLYAVVEGQQM